MSRGCTCGFGPVARAAASAGRTVRDDFRTEVLGLVKAQNVKNAVDRAGGLEGRFLPQAPAARRLWRRRSRAEAVRAYKTFLCGLLDLTDNLSANGHVIHP